MTSKVTSKAQQLIAKYELEAHPEGGHFKQIYKSTENISINNQTCSIGTDIYFLLHSYQYNKDFSAWHMVIDTDEIWHHLEGNDLDIFILNDAGEISTQRLGKSENASHIITVPKNTWFAAIVVDTDSDGFTPEKFTLVSCTCTPGFDYRNFKLGNRKDLLQQFPNQKETINRLTRE